MRELQSVTGVPAPRENCKLVSVYGDKTKVRIVTLVNIEPGEELFFRYAIPNIPLEQKDEEEEEPQRPPPKRRAPAKKRQRSAVVEEVETEEDEVEEVPAPRRVELAPTLKLEQKGRMENGRVAGCHLNAIYNPASNKLTLSFRDQSFDDEALNVYVMQPRDGDVKEPEEEWIRIEPGDLVCGSIRTQNITPPSPFKEGELIQTDEYVNYRHIIGDVYVNLGSMPRLSKLRIESKKNNVFYEFLLSPNGSSWMIVSPTK
jgi:hypothetical protein